MRIVVIQPSTSIESISALEELFIIQNDLKVIDAGYQELKLETPDWVTEKLIEVDHEITTRSRGELMRRLKAAKARRSALKTADEKRSDLDGEIAALEEKLK